MRFAPQPANDFERFYELYYAECRRRVPRIAAIAAKWRFEDLIPGLSDYDTRFIVTDDTTVQDWCDMSQAVGEVHRDLCAQHPHWARNLEHLPGINLTWTELTDDRMWYPEYAQWTFYRTEDTSRLATADQYLRSRSWDERDEYYHLKKFCLFYGRYDRQIDPAVNLGPYENKYALHSRFMHYFCPPLQAALCLLRRHPVIGKMETIRLAVDTFPEPVYRELQQAVDRHYEVPELYAEPALTDLEDRLEQALAALRQTIAPAIRLIPDAGRLGINQWKTALNRVPVSPAVRVIDAARFSRLMKGRLRFYADAPPHFDSTWPIENELLRLRRSFFEVPFRVYWELVTGETIQDPATILPRLCPDPLTAEELRCAQAFVRLLPGRWEPGRQRQIARDLADVFDGFLHGLAKVTGRVIQEAGR